MGTVIFYGVGKHLRHNEKRYIKEIGIPACLVDKDESRWGFMYGFHTEGGNIEERRIVSLEDVKNNYPDYELYITLGNKNLADTYHELLGLDVPRERIKFAGDREYGLGCHNLFNYIYISSDNVKTCAHIPYTNHFWFGKETITEEDVKNKLNELEAWRVKTIEDLRAGKQTTCDGCSALQEGFWPKEARVSTLGVGPNFAGGTKCNSNCFYCYQIPVMKEKSKQTLSNYDIHRIAGEVYDTLDTTILADGEPTLLPNVEKICGLADAKGWAVSLNTSGIKYSEEMANTVARDDRSFVCVSLDSGTRETYKKIKRVDCFDRVVENLFKYKEKGCRMDLKYILIDGINDNLEDINNFVGLCKKLELKHVTLSQNLSGYIDGERHDIEPNMTEKLYASCTYMIARLQEECIAWDFQIEFISKHDYDRLEKLRR